MNEKSKTLTFVGLAIASTALAYGTRPSSVRVEAIDDVGTALFEEFTDPGQATSLKIVRFDESLASLSEIEVKRKEGLWTLPSHDGYPADAENRIRDATTPFIGLESLAIASEQEGDHAMYGVLEPSVEESAVGDQGVGTLVTVEGKGGKTLVDLIIGKQVKDTEEQRYVRRPGQSRVYVAKVDPSKLPVRFEDWIEKDLLQLNGWDISQMVLKDYSFQVSATLSGPVTDYDQRFEMIVQDDNGTWELEEMLVDEGGELVEASLGEDQQLNQDSLREMKEALDGLEIVDVERKPAQLGADLRADKGFANNQAGIDSLLERGFYPVTMPDGELEILSADGEVQLRTKDGVEYILRFGGVEGVDTESEDGALNRYLLVSARVNEDQFPPPELEDVPQTVEELKARQATEAEAADQADAEGGPAEPRSDTADSSSPNGADGDLQVDGGNDEGEAAKTAGDAEAPDRTTADEDAKDESETTDDQARRLDPTETLPVQAANNQADVSDRANDADQVDAEEGTNTEAASDPQSSDEGESSEASAENAAAEDSPGGSNQSNQSDPAEAPDASDDSDASSDSDESAVASESESDVESLEAQLKAEQERITKENQRKIDERNDKLAEARQKVQELNYRFADWYYVISEEVYQKIHLGRDDVVESATEDESSADVNSSVPPGAAGGANLNFGGGRAVGAGQQ